MSPAVSAIARPPHSDEIHADVTIAAMTQTASGRCAETFVNNTTLEKAVAFFHRPQPEMKRLAAAIETALSSGAGAMRRTALTAQKATW